MVDLSNAADKATERAAARNLERKNLDGEKINSGEAYDNEHSEYGTLSDSVTGAWGQSVAVWTTNSDADAWRTAPVCRNHRAAGRARYLHLAADHAQDQRALRRRV